MTLTKYPNAVAEKSVKTKIRLTGKDKAFYTVVGVILLFLLLTVLYPLIYIISASFSSPSAVSVGRVVLWPVDLSLKGYEAVFSYGPVFIGYRNTLFYTAAGTFINVAMTLIAAYPLARKGLPGKGFFTFLFTFTMLFNGGMVASYIINTTVFGLRNSYWVLLLPTLCSAYNIIVLRTFFTSLGTESLIEAAKIDGASELRIYAQIILPISKPALATIGLFTIVGAWNDYFTGLIYLNTASKYPLQTYIRQLVVKVDYSSFTTPEVMAERMKISGITFNAAKIVVSMVPVLCIYPFLQKYFVTGLVMGSVKE